MVRHVFALALLVRGAASTCTEFCKGDCCFFQEPAKECSSCDETWTCNPTVPCYSDASLRHETSQPGADGKSVGSGDAPCQAYCLGTCCGFTTPSKECSGCDSSMGCHPGAECYETGSLGAKSKHAHTPGGGGGAKKHAHTPAPKKHAHTPAAKKHAHTPQQKATAKGAGLHAHTPQQKATTRGAGLHAHTPQQKATARGAGLHVHTPQKKAMPRASVPEDTGLHQHAPKATMASEGTRGAANELKSEL